MSLRALARAGLAAGLLVAPVAPALAAGRTLVILGTTDQHGHLEQAPLLAHDFADERARNPGRVLLIDGGDMFQGTLVSNLHEGAAMVRAYDALGYAAAAVGNHEFDFGPVGPHSLPGPGEDPRGAVKARQREAHFPFLSANIVDDKTGQPIFKPWTLVEVDHVKVGIVGGTTEDTFRTTNPRNLVGLRVEPLAPAVARAAKAARAAGAGVVVVTVHAGSNCSHRRQTLTDADKDDGAGCQTEAPLFQLAHALHDAAANGTGGRVDAIFGGHTHEGVVAIADGIPLLQAFSNGRAFSKLELEIDDQGKPTGHFVAHAPEFVKKDTPPDAKLQQLIAGDEAEVTTMKAAKTGVTLPAPLKREYRAESPLGNFAADLIRDNTHAEVGLTNGGGLRADLPAGELTYGAVFESFPFDNKLATMKMTGADLAELFRRNFGHDKGILSVSGLRVAARCQAGKLQVDLMRADGTPIAPATSLLVGTTDFLANGGDDFAPTMAQRPVTFLECDPLRDVMFATLKSRAAKGETTLTAAQWFDPAHRRLTLPMPKPVVCDVVK